MSLENASRYLNQIRQDASAWAGVSGTDAATLAAQATEAGHACGADHMRQALSVAGVDSDNLSEADLSNVAGGRAAGHVPGDSPPTSPGDTQHRSGGTPTLTSTPGTGPSND